MTKRDRDWRRSAASHRSYAARFDRRRARELLVRAVRERKTMTPAEAGRLYEDLTRALRHLENDADDPRSIVLRRRISRMLTVVRHRAEGRAARAARDEGSGPDTAPRTHRYAVKTFPSGRSKARTFPDYGDAQRHAQDLIRDGRHRVSVIYSIGRRGDLTKIEAWRIGPSGRFQHVWRHKSMRDVRRRSRSRR